MSLNANLMAISDMTDFRRLSDELADAWEEAWNGGDAWKEGIVSGFSRLPKNGVDALKTTLGSDMVESLLKK